MRTAHGEHAADFLLGADGANSLVRKKLARPFSASESRSPPDSSFTAHRASAIAIRSMAEQPGYLWSFPRPDHLAVGDLRAGAAARATSADLRAQSLAWIDDRSWPRATAALEPYAWPIPSAGFSDAGRMRARGPGWMLLGDAAGLVDPLTREGIYYALLSGVWAADALDGRAARRAGGVYAERVERGNLSRAGRAAQPERRCFSRPASRACS